MEPLTTEQIGSEFQDIDLEWSLLAGVSLEREYKFKDFKEALSFVNKLGEVAEVMNHHPDIGLSYGKVSVQVTTHSAGGLTKKDFEFVKAIKEIKV